MKEYIRSLQRRQRDEYKQKFNFRLTGENQRNQRLLLTEI